MLYASCGSQLQYEENQTKWNVVLKNSVFSVMIDVPYRPSWLKIIQVKTTKERVHVRTATSRRGEMKVNEKKARWEWISIKRASEEAKWNEWWYFCIINFIQWGGNSIFEKNSEIFWNLTSIAWQRRVMTVSHRNGIFQFSFSSLLFTVYLVQQVQIQSDFIRIYWAMTTIWERLSTTRVLTLWWQH